MWTSLFPLAWSARSPCLELTSIVAGNGLTPPPAARISPRFRSSISLYGVTSMCRYSRPAGAPVPPIVRRTTPDLSRKTQAPAGAAGSLGTKGRERLLPQHLEAREHADGPDEQHRHDGSGREQERDGTPGDVQHV